CAGGDRPMTSRDFEVRLADAGDTAAVLSALSDGYVRPFTADWFEWKHRSNPWGASRCWVAEDDGGLLGVVFGMPWHLIDNGAPLTCWRLVDGATTVRAQRRGVFRAVVQAELAAAAADTAPGLVIATATPEARDAHVKNGATALPSIQSYYRPVRWTPGRTHAGVDVLDSWQPPAGGITTAWSPEALRWRLDGRGGAPATISALSNTDESHGAVHRTVGGAARTLVVSATWGPERTVRRLLRALAWQEKAVAVLAPAGPGARRGKPALALARGASLLCVWDQRTAPGSTVDGLDHWRLDGLDLEGVV
ncbi:MAG: GNAT family N-acetyltransferase, partial [Ilumatobacteraceae bacterium]